MRSFLICRVISLTIVLSCALSSAYAAPSAAAPSDDDESKRCAPAPLSLSGDAGVNIRAALHANNGRLQKVVIFPGETWSFNAAVGDPRRIDDLREVNGILGGGWCNLAGRYVQAARMILPDHAVHMRPHPNGLPNVDPQDAPSIWNPDGVMGFADGRSDVLITNVLDRTIIITAVERRSSVVVCVETDAALKRSLATIGRKVLHNRRSSDVAACCSKQ